MTTYIYGTDDDDFIQQNSAVDLRVYAYAGDDEIILNRVDSLGGFNWVSAGDGDDIVRNSYEGGNDIYLGNGNDIYTHDGYAIDSTERDNVFGGAGNDLFRVKTLESVYNGDSGNDTFQSVGYENTFHGGTGTDTISYQLQDSSDLRGSGVYVDLDEQYAKVGSDMEDLISIENAIGTSYNDTLIGTFGRNTLNGGSGHDELDGLGGNDLLIGGNGDDDLFGGSGNDILRGDRGNDILQGNSGADYFDFNSIADSVVGSRRDVIEDFSRSQGDYIDLRGIDADTTYRGNQAFDYIGSSNFSGTAGELRYKSYILSADVDGDGRSDFQVEVNATKLYTSDFLL
ncbi:calcium-binding protein [Sinorhizobium sp. BG8]|uniref:calcium-binding protein n=1 Tax=Sinorhizobium sp. BG8 TaxID=2613773 RepID=UPI00193DF4F0|nr:calcium-binding protein [Sinorhizobium sp. BG8]QRM54805.1 calcium-binding protein [Sinorhizobium sp. BG8]